MGTLTIRVGCEFHYEAAWQTPAVVQVRPRQDGAHRVLREEQHLSPDLPSHDYQDLYGNVCQRLTIPPGDFVLRYDALVEVPSTYDELALHAAQVSPDQLPDDALLYTLPSRYCVSDVLSDAAWQLFAGTEPGGARVQAICDWVHTNIRFQYGTSTPLTTALDVYEKRVGVCRDFTHLGVTFCRAMNIPARYVFGYLPDIGVPVADAPMDFCAWFEAYLEGRWWPFDPRNNTPRIGRTVIGRGRDALDVAMVTTYGSPRLVDMTVWADEASSATPPAVGDGSPAQDGAAARAEAGHEEVETQL